MKKYIEYYYNIKVKNLLFLRDKYIILGDDSNYLFKICTNLQFLNSYEYLKSLIFFSSNYKKYFYVVPNKTNEYITYLDGKPYLLLKIVEKFNSRKIVIEDLSLSNYIYKDELIKKMSNYPWYDLWITKVDYIEKLFQIKKKEYANGAAVIDFYIGLSENAIMYFFNNCINLDENNLELALQHYRIGIDYDLYDYYDISNIVVDHPIRDISEYIKNSIINNGFNINEFEKYIDRNNFSNIWLKLLYSRILFPTFFFDEIEKKELNNIKIDFEYLEGIIKKLITNLGKISNLFLNEYNIPIVEWIIKKT